MRGLCVLPGPLAALIAASMLEAPQVHANEHVVGWLESCLALSKPRAEVLSTVRGENIRWPDIAFFHCGEPLITLCAGTPDPEGCGTAVWQFTVSYLPKVGWAERDEGRREAELDACLEREPREGVIGYLSHEADCALTEAAGMIYVSAIDAYQREADNE